MKKQSLSGYQVMQPLLLSLFLTIGMFVGFKLAQRSGNAGKASARHSSAVQEVIDLVNYRYVDAIDLDSIESYTIEKIVESLDPHTYYIPPSDLALSNAELHGEFSGIGIEYLIIRDTVTVVYVMDNGPSAKAGLLVGDRILKIGNTELAGENLEYEELMRLMRNKPGSVADLHILRDGRIMAVDVTRGMVNIPSVDVKLMSAPGIGYIHISKFTSHTYQEFMDAITGLQKEGMKSLILDLRGNPGGMMQQATHIADEFLEDGLLIVRTNGQAITDKETRATKPGVFEQGSLIVLIDQFSASASEVLAGALQDNDRGTVIGERSFGKGLIQEQYDLFNGGALRLTVGRYFTPTGRSIQKPYGGSRTEYVHEVLTRGTNDSTWHADRAQVYVTKGGKKLFGGGGITPDVLINPRPERAEPMRSRYFDADSIYRFSFEWYSAHLGQIKGFESASAFLKTYRVPEEAWRAYINRFSRGDTAFDRATPAQKEMVTDQMKANIARFAWRNDGYFEARRNRDSAFQQAIDILQNPAESR